jgi:hypothetical protein
VRPLLVVSGIALATTVSGCGSSVGRSEPHYSATRFRHCLVKHHFDVTSPRSEVVIVRRSSSSEWVQFFGTARLARKAQSSLSDSPVPRFRMLREALRARRGNALVFGPEKGWRSLVDLCLKPAPMAK